MRKLVIVIIFTISSILFLSLPISACPIPVFKYAMEFWESDLYEVFIFYEGEFSKEEQDIIDMLEEAVYSNNPPVNIKVSKIDLTQTPNENHPIWREQDAYTLPWVVFYYPVTSGLREPLWGGKLESYHINNFIDSPKRNEIARLLLDETSAVWILLESGNRTKDAEVERLLNSEIERLEEVLKLPDPVQWGWSINDDLIPSEISFSIVNISRDDPAEYMFVEMLLNTESGLEDYNDTPMVFPIYGRGLVMYALIGEGINEWTITEAGEFLVGPCSCVVKALNPGTDLVMSVDWEAQIRGASPVIVPSLGGTGGFLDVLDETKELFSEGSYN